MIAYKIQFSHTNISQDEKCPEAMRQIYVLKAFKKTYSGAQTSGISAHKALDQRIKSSVDLPPELAGAERIVQAFERQGNVETEVSFGIDHMFQPMNYWDAWVRGKCDVVIRNREVHKAILADWKTGAQTQWNEVPDQLGLEAILLMQNDPEIHFVTGFNVWLKEGRLGEPYRFSRGNGATAKLTSRLREIERRKPDEPWEKRRGPLCKWCPVASCEHYVGG